MNTKLAVRWLTHLGLGFALVVLDGLLVEVRTDRLVTDVPWPRLTQYWACIILVSLTLQWVLSRKIPLRAHRWVLFSLAIANGCQLSELLFDGTWVFLCCSGLLFLVALTPRVSSFVWAAALTALWMGSGPLGFTPPSVEPGEAGPDIVLLTIDTVREDALSSSPRALVAGLTPQLDALAQSGCQIEQASSTSPLTGPSHAAMLSGVHPIELGLFQNGRTLPADVPWLPEELQKRGYQTAAFVSSAMLEGDLGYRRGFAIYDDDQSGLAAIQSSTLAPLFPKPRISKSDAFSRFGLKTIEKMDQWLATTNPKVPVFIWLHLYDAHRPYVATQLSQEFVKNTEIRLPPAESFSQWKEKPVVPKKTTFTQTMFSDLQNLDPEGQKSDHSDAMVKSYLAGVRDLDRLVGTAWERINRHRPDADRVWAIVSDHGESLTEHGELGSHQFNVYEANIRVPFLLSSGDCPTAPISTINVGHALIHRAGLQVDWTHHKDIEAAVKVGKQAPSHPSTTKVSTRVGDQKLVAAVEAGQSHHVERYDLAADRHEMTPLPESSEMVEQFIQAVKPRLASTMEAKVTDQSVNEALRALGYIDE